jgi:ABC-2 type transport system permease protein
MLAIYKKELRSYFTSIIGYVFIAIFLVLVGFLFYLQNLYTGYAQFERTLSGISSIFVMLVPLLTMRLMAEENRQKTDQLLYTSPVSAGAIVMGKFLAVFTVFLSAMAVTCFYPLILMPHGEVPLVSAYAGILGFAFIGGAYLAIGLFISSLTESQVVAAVISFIVFFFTISMEALADYIPADNRTTFIVISIILFVVCVILYLMMHNLTVAVGTGIIVEAVLAAVYLMKPVFYDGLISKIFGWLSVLSRYSSFYLGILDLADIIYYISIIVLFTFLTTQVIKKKRWS